MSATAREYLNLDMPLETIALLQSESIQTADSI